MSEALIAPSARARFVVTLPPDPSRIGQQLAQVAGSSFASMIDTRDAFAHLARRARERLVVMTPFVDEAGASWAADLFEATSAPRRELVLRETSQLLGCGISGERLSKCASIVHDYAFRTVSEGGKHQFETFHAKIVLADGVAAYVGSANFLHRSRELNLECGFLLDGDAVAPVAILVDAVLKMFTD